ncbi:unnamed protein product [Closterium sp. Yama58-4]|nr:unnamed protein product [Closterium sp. Yama58-4]
MIAHSFCTHSGGGLWVCEADQADHQGGGPSDGGALRVPPFLRLRSPLRMLTGGGLWVCEADQTDDQGGGPSDKGTREDALSLLPFALPPCQHTQVADFGCAKLIKQTIKVEDPVTGEH